jgi:hypothetical protein
MFEKNDRVKVNQIIDDMASPKLVGQEGVVTKPGTGENIEEMIEVEMSESGKVLTFWPEEIEKIV